MTIFALSDTSYFPARLRKTAAQPTINVPVAPIIVAATCHAPSPTDVAEPPACTAPPGIGPRGTGDIAPLSGAPVGQTFNITRQTTKPRAGGHIYTVGLTLKSYAFRKSPIKAPVPRSRNSVLTLAGTGHPGPTTPHRTRPSAMPKTAVAKIAAVSNLRPFL